MRPLGPIASRRYEGSDPQGGYIYVNNKEPSMEWKDITDRAAQTMFWTELARGFGVTLGTYRLWNPGPL